MIRVPNAELMTSVSASGQTRRHYPPHVLYITLPPNEWSSAWGADGRIERALQYIIEHSSAMDLRLEDVAGHVRLSKWHLVRLLKSQTGWGFRQHLAGARVARALELLLEGKLIVKEVAAAVGYRHVSHMDRQFRTLLRTAPNDIRRRPGRTDLLAEELSNVVDRPLT